MGIKYFEDIRVGDSAITAGRTVTEADVASFAGLSGDFNPIHMDREFARNTVIGRRIAHGLLVLSIGSGLFTQCEMNMSIRSNVMALMDVRWKFLKPVFLGDTVYLKAEVLEKKEVTKPDRGIVIQQRAISNQSGEVVQQGTVTLMVRRRPSP